MATAMEVIERPIVTNTRRTLRIDPEASQASFTIRNRFAFISHQVITGRFNDVTGIVMLDKRHPTNSRVTLEICTAGVSTGNRRREKHLLADEVFAVDRFPTMSFVSEAVEPIDPAEGRYLFTGILSIRGVERSAGFEVELDPGEPGGSPWPARVLASGTLDRRDFGMTWSNPMVRIADRVDIALTIRTVLSDSVTS